ncbi:MAG: GNAT family N-acetyltransferase [Clostridia bacterium]|nr:GNAT family N-acetyltransferase [Clostridia bacterium]
MTIVLSERTEETVRIYFENAKQPFVKENLPQKAKSVEEALDDYRKTLLPGAASFGRTITVDGKYVGDVWCYCIDKSGDPNAMLSFCIFDGAYLNKGIATKAVGLFINEVHNKYDIGSIGAFAFSDNHASQRVLEKNGFVLAEEFVEDGRKSKYYQYTF